MKRRTLRVIALMILGLGVAAPTWAQDNGPAIELQPAENGPFSEELAQLRAATDAKSRRGVFASILKKANADNLKPAPLTAILDNQKPADTCRDLIEWITTTESARVTPFIAPLVMIHADAGDNADRSLAAVLSYGKDAVPVITAMMGEVDDNARRAAGAQICRYRPGGLRGSAELVAPLVRLLRDDNANVSAGAKASLQRIARLNLTTSDEWEEWLDGKSVTDLMEEIGNREIAARKSAEDELRKVQQELLKVLLERMRKRERDDPTALGDRLANSPYATVRIEAAKLLGAFIPDADPEPAQQAIDALGTTLVDAEASNDVRKECAKSLVACGKSEEVFPWLDKCIEQNGITSDLKLEVVKGLSHPVAALRLASLLKTEVDHAGERSGELLDVVVRQARIVAPSDPKDPNQAAILGELTRLLNLVATKIEGDIDTPTRKRLLDVAVNVNQTLVHLARIRRVDISSCIDALVKLANTENGAATSAITAIRQALDVPAARESLTQRIVDGDLKERLKEIYRHQSELKNEPMLIHLLGLYEVVGQSPVPVEVLQTQLTDWADASEATIPAKPSERNSLRDSVRALVQRLTPADKQSDFLNRLLDCKHASSDAAAYLLLFTENRVVMLNAITKARIETDTLKTARFFLLAHARLTNDERANESLTALATTVTEKATSAITTEIDRATNADTFTDESSKRLRTLGTGVLRPMFVKSCVAKLGGEFTNTVVRDALATLLLEILREAHPDRYADSKLAGDTPEAYGASLNALKAKLKEDAYDLG